MKKFIGIIFILNEEATDSIREEVNKIFKKYEINLIPDTTNFYILKNHENILVTVYKLINDIKKIKNIKNVLKTFEGIRISENSNLKGLI